MKLIPFLSAVVAAAILATPALSRSPRTPHHQARWYHLTLREKLSVVNREIHRNRGTVQWWLHHRQRIPDSSQAPYRLCVWLGIRTPTVICHAGWRLHKARTVAAVINDKIEVITQRALTRALVARHYQGWMCIHAREGAWNASTGNGFYGGLQMTYGWAGRVSNASLLSPAAQIAAAEAEAAEHGWSWTWMQGQWPRTFPPCAGWFS